MAGTLTTPSRETLVRTSSGGGGPRGGSSNGGRGDGGGGGDPGAFAVERYKLGVWIGAGGIVMFFAALTSAMVVRSGLSDDWRPLDMPRVLWFSTAVLLLSSFSLERAKRSARQGPSAAMRHWLSATAALGGLFLVLQLMGWNELAGRGVFISSNPSSSFFYVFTAAHGVHVLGGVAALAYVVVRAWLPTPWITRRAAVEATAVYWHFMDALWVYLFLLLMFWR